MKRLFIALWFLTLCFELCNAQEQASHSTASFYHNKLDYEASLGLGMGKDCNTNAYWKVGPCAGIGLNYTYVYTPLVHFRAGLSEQIYSSSRIIDHPYPYVMDMELVMATVSTRLSAAAEVAHKNQYQEHSCFIGAGLFGDIVHGAKAYHSLFYITETDRKIVDMKDSFKAITPGLMLYVGAKLPLGRIEVRYMEDLSSFKIPKINIGAQRRTCVGVNFALYQRSFDE